MQYDTQKHGFYSVCTLTLTLAHPQMALKCGNTGENAEKY